MKDRPANTRRVRAYVEMEEQPMLRKFRRRRRHSKHKKLDAVLIMLAILVAVVPAVTLWQYCL